MAVRPATGISRPEGRERMFGLASRQSLSRVTVMVIRFAAMALNFLVQLVMAHVMGLSAFGSANTALALLNILVIPAALGYDTAAIRYVALTHDDRPLLRALTVRFVRMVTVGSLLTCLIVATGAVLEHTTGRNQSAIGLAMLVLIIPSFALVRVGEGWLRGFGCLVRALVNSGVVIPVLSIVLLLAQRLLIGAHHPIGVGGALGSRALATVVSVVLVGVFVSNKLNGHLRPRRHLERSMTSEISKVAFGLCWVAALTMAVSQMDIVAVSYLSGPSQAGVYSAAARVSQAMNVCLVAVNFVLAPRIARLFAERRTEQLQHEVSSAATWSSCLMASACAILIPASPLVLSIFGPGFSSGANALRILMLGQLVNSICGPAGAVLNMTGRQSQAIRVLGVSALIDVVLFVVLIPSLGLTGAACATAVCTACWNIGMLVYIRRDLRIWSLPGLLVRAVT